MTTAAFVQVVAAAVFDDLGRVLIARRPVHVHQGGLWEFPGGKVEPGESAEAALARELWEELHIAPVRSRPLIRIPHRYPDKNVLLDVWRVDAFRGEPSGREGQPVRWVSPSELPGFAFPAANRAIMNAVRLPPYYAISGAWRGEEAFRRGLQQALEAGARLIQLRLQEDSPAVVERAAAFALSLCRARGASVVLNGPAEAALALGLDGVHLSARALAAVAVRPVPPELWCGASCHSREELARAAQLGVDFAVLGPVAPTASHPGAPALGWERFADIVRDAPLPVYALGGLRRDDLPRALASRAQGVAAIRALWGP